MSSLMALLLALPAPVTTEMTEQQLAELSAIFMSEEEAGDYVEGAIELSPPDGRPSYYFVTEPVRRGDFCVRHQVRFDRDRETETPIRYDQPQVALGLALDGSWTGCPERGWIQGALGLRSSVDFERLLDIARDSGHSRSGDYVLTGDAERARELLAGLDLAGIYRIDREPGITRWQFGNQSHARLGSIEIEFRYVAEGPDQVEVREPHRV
ncbi:hypothetical protein [Sphingomicrobium sediminis]|uniref:Uncharacterized protein n=1 Tax=Sphingomicrobium sediminis TaxID=2950949 RepID=A0A9X2EFA0_9SPHN|nr:hypothetical protein [Sphingomicrobium sediminis]MCM8556490.1 hypothetical protein [Sphingomicrobium sediminis]